MTIPELTIEINNQISLLTKLYKSYVKDVKEYPNGDYNLVSLSKLEYLYNTLLTMNDILANK